MNLVDTIVHTLSKPFIEWPVRGKSIDAIAEQLERGLQPILDRFQSGGDSDQNRRVLSHIIGIERWGQSRLKVFLGDPLVMDEYDGYRPNRETSSAELVEMMKSTRAETAALARQITKLDASAIKTVHHNQFGPLSPRGWLFYLYFHARAESQKMRAR